MTCRRCREGADAFDVVDAVKEVRDCVPGERSGYGEGDEGGFGVDTPSAFASLASLPGAIGVRERGVLMGPEESRERGFGPIEGGFVVCTGIRVGSQLDGCGFGFGGMLLRDVKEGTGAAVVQDIVVDLILLQDYRLGYASVSS